MSNQSPPPYPYQTGQVVNGHVWTGTQWLPVEKPKVGFKLGGLEIALIVGAIILAVVGYSIVDLARG